MKKVEKIKAWVQASRPPFFVATLIPLSAGAVMAGKQGYFRLWPFLFVLLGSFLVHFATNIANDYFDHVQGADADEAIGGSRVIQDGKIAASELLVAIIVLYIMASAIGLGLAWLLDVWVIVPLMVIGAFSSLFYVAPPVRYGYHGLGEVFVGINMGPVMVLGSYWVMSGRTDFAALPASIPIGLMVALILYYQNLPDIETDERSAKRTLAVRMGKSRAMAGLWVFWCAVYASVALLIICDRLTAVAWCTFLTIPLPVHLWRKIRKVNSSQELDRYGSYIRAFYFINGLILIAALL